MTSTKNIMHVINYGFYYFDRYGRVRFSHNAKVDNYGVYGHFNTHYSWKALNKSFFLTKAKCEKAAKKYRDSLNVPLRVIKKLSSLKPTDTFYYKDDNKEIQEETLDYHEGYLYYPTEKVFYLYDSYYNGLYDQGTEEAFPLKKYGKTWALSIEDFK